MASRRLNILSSLRASAALSLVEAQHAGYLASFELDAYVLCNTARADVLRLYYELWSLRKAAFSSESSIYWAIETPEGDSARLLMVPTAIALQLSYFTLASAEYRLSALTCDWTGSELTRLRETASLLPVGG